MSKPLVAVMIDGWVDPAELFDAHEAREANSFFFDAGPHSVTGWSYLGAGVPAAMVDVYAVHPVAHSDDWPAGPFRGGWVCWLAYEDGAHAAGAPYAESAQTSRALRVDEYVAFDHASRRIWAVAEAARVSDYAADVLLRIAAAAPVEIAEVASPDVIARQSPQQYSVDIETCREAIRRGDAYQLCLTTRFTIPGAHDAVAAFHRLRNRTASHHAAFLRIDDVALVSASPEQFLTIADGRVQTKPIKGTRKRGVTAEADDALRAELLASEKERAENVMIVDLMRNDLSRVCDPGTVRVDGLWQVESYPAVHQLVSTVSGQLRADVNLGDVIAAAFPAGSMTGAPKLSAMTLLHDIEREPRGIYAGCFGWVGTDGSADLAMVIRSIIVTADEAYVGAGGGITWGSVAADEVAEVAIKARAPLAALGALVPPGWESAG